MASRLRGYFRRRLADAPHDVEDLVPETLLAIHLQRGTIDATMPVTAWLHAIARHKLIDRWRRLGRSGAPAESFDDLDERDHPVAADGAESARDLGVLLQQLSPAQRRSIVDTKIEGLSVAEAARAAGMSESAVKANVHRGLRKLARMARPAASGHRATAALALVVGAMAVWTVLVLGEAPPGGRTALLLGQSWASCPWRVAALAVPASVAALLALRGLAPTRLRGAGFAAGLVGGASGALAYALYCSEVSPAFVLLWYTLGMHAPAALGAWLGPRLLRW